MFQTTSKRDFSRQYVKGVFFCKTSVNAEACRRLVEELGCQIIMQQPLRLTIKATRGRLQELKERHQAQDNDKADISERLKEHFDRILIGGNVN